MGIGGGLLLKVDEIFSGRASVTFCRAWSILSSTGAGVTCGDEAILLLDSVVKIGVVGVLGTVGFGLPLKRSTIVAIAYSTRPGISEWILGPLMVRFDIAWHAMIAESLN